MGELEIHINDSQIIVNARGTRLTVTYQVSADRQSLVEQPFWTGDDRNAPISLDEFRRNAWLAARRRAHEIGWMRADTSSSDDMRRNGTIVHEVALLDVPLLASDDTKAGGITF